MAEYIDSRELAWAAGLFDGEGSVSARKPSPASRAKGSTAWLAVARLAMTDQDAVRRFHSAIGFGKVSYICTPKCESGDYKPQWEWRVAGHEGVQALAALVWYGLSARRKNQFATVLRGVRENAGRFSQPKLRRKLSMKGAA